ncbi:IS3 family transposase [Corynebacterium macginleyi]|uniref:IS3 family transposase n=1 Tax=Corynebacterium macginleyi TaxID=38290 RepID=UPI00190D2F6B|nr:IS3 family transposase [Corynebacterium macginleyi]MBK4146443.1 IS3 family transposase [Corynebacterium macginleyi]
MVIASPRARGLSARCLRDAVLVERISAIHRDNDGVLGVRTMWHALDRNGIDIGREHTARLMRLAGVSGTDTGGSPITTRKPNVPDLRPDVVEREFKAQGLKQAMGGRHYLRAHEEGLCVHRVCH